MGRKAMLRFFSLRHHHDRPSQRPQPQNSKTFSATLMQENISIAETIIVKWDTNSQNPNTAASLFKDKDKDKAYKFVQAVADLQRAMVFFTSSECLENPTLRTHYLILAQGLMQIAMRRLEKELYQILSSNRDRLDPEIIASVSEPDSKEENRTAIGEVEEASANALEDLRSITQTMIMAGYGKECIKIYKMMRKSIVDEALYRLGFEFLNLVQIQKLEWQVLDLKIRSWLAGIRVVVRTLFAGERILCDRIFEGSDLIRECCFADITKDAAINLLCFAEMITKTKRSSEKLFRTLDMYISISELLMDIESVFSFESTSGIRSQALNSLLKLTETARLTLSDFESAIKKDTSKTCVPGGGIHPITRYVMNYVIFLADYDSVLADIYAGIPLEMLSLPESFLDSSVILSAPPTPSYFVGSPKPEITVRFAWLILLLLCKLDGKAENYKEAALSYLFLANNLRYVVNKVKESRLGVLLGEDWITKHSAKANYYVSSYVRLWWSRVAEAIPPPEAVETVAEERIRGFNANFGEAIRLQRDWVIADPKTREEVRSSVAELIVPGYRYFYEAYRPFISGDVADVGRDGTALRFAPEDIMGRVTDLFSRSGSESGAGSAHGSSKSSLWSGSGSH